MTTRQTGGPAGPQPIGPAPASLFQATARLESVIAGASVIDPWCAELQSALRECTTAVQYHLDSFEGVQGMKEQILRDEPRLISRLEEFDVALRALLAELAEARRSAVDSTHALVEPLGRLAAELRDAAIGEIDILHEALISTGSGD